jgi:Flp pilus assembly pilin Flp
MKNWIMNFIADERGSEGPELAITTLVVAGGAIAGFGELKSALKTKQDNMVTELGGIDVE